MSQRRSTTWVSFTRATAVTPRRKQPTRELCAFAKRLSGRNTLAIAPTLDNLASVYCQEGRFAEAEPLYSRALAITQKARGPDHPDTANQLHNIASFYGLQGKTAEAERLYRQALSIQEKALGPEHPDVATTLDNLATVCSTGPCSDDVLNYERRSLAIREKTLGPQHPDVARSLNNLGSIYHRRGWYSQAEPLFQRALSIMEKSSRTDRSELATLLDNAAALYGSQGRYTEVLALTLHLEMRADAVVCNCPAETTNGLDDIMGDREERAPVYQRDVAMSAREAHVDLASTSRCTTEPSASVTSRRDCSDDA